MKKNMDKNLIPNLIETFKGLSDPKRIESSSANHPTQLTVIGITATNIHKVLKELKQLTRKYSIQERFQLRELSKREPEAVKDFIGMYSDRLHGRVIREVTHKLVHGTKN